MREDDRHKHFLLGEVKSSVSPESLGNRGVHPAFHEVRGVGASRIVQIGEEIGQGPSHDEPYTPEFAVYVYARFTFHTKNCCILFLPNAVEQLPNFHSDNGSEYINKIVAKLLQKLLIDQTKSRAWRTNDNALVEDKNGAVVRKWMGYRHIPKRYTKVINEFYLSSFN